MVCDWKGNSVNCELLMQGWFESMDHKKTNGFLKVQDGEESASFKDSKSMLSGVMKRGLHHCSPPLETCHSSIRKINASGEEDIHQQLSAVNMYHLREKVDAVVLQQKVLGEKCICTSLINRSELADVVVERGKTNGDVRSFCAGISEPSDATDSSSSGSNNLDMLYHYSFVGPCLDIDNLSDDADSSCSSKPEEKQPVIRKKPLAAKILELELHGCRDSYHYEGPVLLWSHNLGT